jgi:hypothetical protein
MNSTVLHSVDLDNSDKWITDIIIGAFIVYMSFVGLIFICCCFKPCLRGIILCIYDSSIFRSKKKIVEIITIESPNKIIDLSAVVVLA